ncbi:MAG TPA: YbhB/YbcL family Raf kinase inhibitor-like protein [Caulobacteraceae bacterium]|nr:YbhB/YbcL family Raf kinase inhibitor-like protein [Caulobacteraceae bacterium]
MKPALALALALAAICGPAAAAGRLAIDELSARTAAPLAPQSTAIGPAGVIAFRYSAFGTNRSIPLSWRRISGARAYAVIMQDPDAPSPSPFVHWLIWDIPGGTTTLSEGLPARARLSAPAGALQGQNGAGSIGYHGPHPPPGPAHHYHVQVFALDAPAAAAPAADINGLLSTLRGHVIAKGEIVGAFKAP